MCTALPACEFYAQISRSRRRRRVPTWTVCLVRRVWSTRVVQGAFVMIWRRLAAVTLTMVVDLHVALMDRLMARRVNCDCLLAACRRTSRSRMKDRAAVRVDIQKNNLPRSLVSHYILTVILIFLISR